MYIFLCVLELVLIYVHVWSVISIACAWKGFPTQAGKIPIQ